MNRKHPVSYSSANRSSLDTFHGLAATYLSCAERLTALNLACTRGMLDEIVAASMQRPASGSDFGFNLPQIDYGKPVFEKAITHSYSVFEVLLESQQEAIRTLSSQFTSTNANFNLPADWTAPFELFTKGMQEVSSLTKKNAIAETASKLTKAV